MNDSKDPLLDRFVPDYDVREQHSIRIAAPPGIVLETAAAMDLEQPWIVRLIIRTREFVLGAKHEEHEHRGLIEFTRSLGWGLLAESPGDEIVMGAITQPWMAEVVFQPLPPGEFATYTRPGYVKIAWTLRAEPNGEGQSVFHTETRVVACDDEARGKFRSYWTKFSIGIRIIRLAILRPLKKEAERRYRATVPQ